MAARIKKDDLVYIISGDDKGKTGKVKTLLMNKGQVIVEGVNVKTKHVKPTQTSRGGRLQVERPISISKVQPVDPKTGLGTRVKYVTAEGFKKRIAVKTGSDLGVISKA